MIRRRCSFKKYAWKVVSGKSPLIINNSERDRFRSFSVIGKSEQVTTTGKNLFDYKDFVDINTYIDNTGSYRRKYLQLKPNTAYRVTIFKNRMTPAGDTTVMFIGDKETYDNTSANGIIAFFTSNEKKSATITTKESGQIVFKLNASSMSESQEEYLSQADIIFSEGTTEIPYEPYTGGKPSPSPEYPQEIKSVGKYNSETQKYEVDIKVTNAKESWDKEQTVTLTSDRPITKWDRLVEQNGQIGWLYQSAIDNDVKPSRKDLFPYELRFYKDHGTGVYTYYGTNDKKEIGYQTSLCKQFKNVNGSYTTGGLFHYSDQPSLKTQYFSTDIPTVEEFKQWMENNPLTMLYKTKTPEFVPLPQSEQDSIRALISYSPTTIITVDGGEVDPSVEVLCAIKEKM